jgi:hypothetical protein
MTLLWAVGWLLPITAGASNLQWTQRIKMTTAYDTNRQLVSNDERGDLSARVDLSGALAYETETSKLAVRGNVSATRHEELQEYDNDIFDLTLSAAKQTEFSTSQVDFTAVRDTSLTSEFETTGYVQARIDRTKNLLVASHNHRINETLTAGAKYSLTDIDYDRGVGTPLVDYRYQVMQLSLSGDYSEQLGWGLSGSYSDFRAPDIDRQSDTASLSTSIIYYPDNKTRLSGSLGYSNTNTDYPSSSSSDDQGTVNFALSLWREFEDFDLQLDANRLEQPTGSGHIQTVERVAANLRREITPRWSTRINLGASRYSLDDLGSSDNYRHLVSVTASTGYQITKEFSVNAFYRARDQWYSDNDDSAVSHAVGLELSYSWPEKNFTH